MSPDISPWLNRVTVSDALTFARALPGASVQTIVTSPPYWGLRAYGTTPQIWGGSPSCKEHVWGDPITEKRRGQDAGATAIVGNTRAWVCPTETQQGQFCIAPNPDFNYGNELFCGAWRGELGSEPEYPLYIEHIVQLAREWRRVLRDDGTLWLNLGDSYHNGDKGGYAKDRVKATDSLQRSNLGANFIGAPNRQPQPGLKNKDLTGIPWRVAFALQEDGWYLRSAITWCKRAPMPESITDRPTAATEMIFLLAKSERYFYDHHAVRVAEQATSSERYEHLAADGRMNKTGKYRQALEGADFGIGDGRARTGTPHPPVDGKRNLWNYWLLNPEPYHDAHFATFPTEIPRTAIRAATSARGCCPSCGAPWARVIERTGAENERERADVGDWLPHKGGNPSGMRSLSGSTYQPQRRATDEWMPTCKCPGLDPVPCVVYEPFVGSGTTCAVALELGRDFIGSELNPEYAALAEQRIGKHTGWAKRVALPLEVAS